jgi:hypothetical protein
MDQWQVTDTIFRDTDNYLSKNAAQPCDWTTNTLDK